MPYNVQQGAPINAQDLNQLVTVLQRPAGSQEIGGYFISLASPYNNAVGATYSAFQSRNATATSVTLNTNLQNRQNFTFPVVDHYDQYGVHIYAFSTSGNASCNVGGQFTASF